MSAPRRNLTPARAEHSAPSARRQGGVALHHDPLGEEQILERFYRPQGGAQADTPGGEAALEPVDDPLALAAFAKKPRPTHYKIVCISLYTQDIERLERMVESLKSRGHTKANKSQLIRAALDQVDLDKVPKGH